ncbi:hypothetical protein [Colwellia sp. KU-HH00111]|uniref:hypothetical protein n=1 Tax=Colwellia sp. KU-HH00111 TaxID=3127652 RepID=UPI003365A524
MSCFSTKAKAEQSTQNLQVKNSQELLDELISCPKKLDLLQQSKRVIDCVDKFTSAALTNNIRMKMARWA